MSSSAIDAIPPNSEAKSTFAVDVLKMATGTTSSQLLSALTAPIIARLFAPEAFGIAALFGSMLGVVGILVCLRYESSILLPEDDVQAADAVVLSLLIAATIASIAGFAFWLFSNPILHWLNAPTLKSALWMLPPAIFLYGATVVLTNWCTRQKQFGHLTIAQFTMTFAALTFQLIAGFSGHLSANVIIASTVLGSLCNVLYMTGFALRTGMGRSLTAVSGSGVRFALRRYRRFASMGTPAAVLNSISWQLPAFLLSAFFSAGVVGQFSFGNRLLRMPMNLIGINIGRVFLQRAAEARVQGTLQRSAESAFRYLVALSMFPCLLLAFVGKDVFMLLLGRNWADAGLYAQILSPWVCVWFVSSPLSVVFTVSEELKLDLRIQILIFSSRLGSLLVGGLMHNVVLALALFSGTGVLAYGYYCILGLKICGANVRQMVGVFSENVLRFVPAGAIIVLLQIFNTPALGIVGVSVLLTAGYYVQLARTDPQARALLRTFYAGAAARISR